MKTYGSGLAVWVALHGTIAAAGCSQASTRPATDDVVPLEDAGASSDGTSPEARAVVDAAARADGSDASDATSDATVTPPECMPAQTWTTLPSTAWESSVARFGGISQDERTMAWTTTPGGTTAPTVNVATRTDRSAAFGAPTQVPTTGTAIAIDRVALNPTGNVIVAVAADRTSLVAFEQTGGTWGLGSSTQFANLAAMAMNTTAAFYEPVLGGDGSLYYVLGSSGVLSLYQSTWDAQGQLWSTGVVLTTSVAGEVLTSPDAAHLRRPTGASNDGRTLFLFDGALGHERAASRDTLTDPFSQIVDIPALAEAAPDTRCDRIYFESSGSVFTAQ